MDTELNTQAPINPVLPKEPEKPKSTKNITILTAVVILIIFGLGLAFGLKFLKTSKTPVQEPSNSTNNTSNQSTNKTEPLISGMVDWHYPSQGYVDVFKNTDEAKPYISSAKFYNVGTFKSGQYQGDYLIVAILPCVDLCTSPVVRFVQDQKSGQTKYVALKNYSDPLDNLDDVVIDKTKFSVDSETKISDLEIPKNLTGPKPNQNLILASNTGFSGNYQIFNATNLKPVYQDPTIGQVYTSPDDLQKVESFFGTNGFYVKMPDWNTIVYKITPDFVNADNIPQVVWNDNSSNADEFSYVNIGGCGSSDYAAIAKGVNLSDLKVTGKTRKGDLVYELKDPNSQILKDIYKNDYHPYDPKTFIEDPTLKIPYDQFVASHPVFFWTDPFSRLIQFKNKKFVVQMAECGKPVIYLYPEQAEQVSVKLSPVGGFTYSEPVYNSGWNVIAEPNGQLTNLADGKNYPYLFWEGRGGLYQTPEKGFVIAAADVHEFFTEKLSQLGLNAQEAADFEQYWEPYFTKAPYYFVTFMGNSAMNQIAPLEVAPKPDTVIRILMDFKPLNQPIKVQGYNIITPVRRGFTVVEWGGVKP